MYDKRDDFYFELVNFQFLMEMFLAPLPMVYTFRKLFVLQRVCSNVDDFNNRNKLLTSKLLKQGYRYHKFRKAISKFYYRHSEMIVKYNICLKTLLHQGISERIVGKPNCSDQFKKSIKRYKRAGYSMEPPHPPPPPPVA